MVSDKLPAPAKPPTMKFVPPAAESNTTLPPDSVNVLFWMAVWLARSNVPALTVVEPVYVFGLLNVTVPVPLSETLALPPMPLVAVPLVSEYDVVVLANVTLAGLTPPLFTDWTVMLEFALPESSKITALPSEYGWPVAAVLELVQLPLLPSQLPPAAPDQTSGLVDDATPRTESSR